MARRRMIDPSFWDDTAVGSLTLPARILFIALFSNADDEGRIAADHRFLRRTAFGFDDVSLDDVDGWLEEIVNTLRNVSVYEVEGRRYAQLSRWSDYQTINRPSPSKLPPPPKTRSRKIHESITDDSVNDHGVLIDDSLAREEKGREVKRREEKGKEEKKNPPLPPAPPPEPALPSRGDLFLEPEVRGKDGDGEWVPIESDRNAVFAAGARFLTRHNDPNWTELERQAAFAEWMGKWFVATAAGDFERELALSRTAYTIYPALQKAAARIASGGIDATQDISEEGAREEGGDEEAEGRNDRDGTGAGRRRRRAAPAGKPVE